MRIGFLGFGEAGRAFAATLGARDAGLTFSAWDIKLGDNATAPEMRAALEAHGVVQTDVAGLGAADWLFSAVTADQSLIALQSIAAHLHEGQVVIDINSVSPGRKRVSAALVEARGARYLDMAVMAPVHPRGHATPALIAGAPADRLAAELGRLGFDFATVGAAAGAATAIKMVRSLFVKGLEALTVETLLAAEASGCFDTVLDSLSKSFGGLGWPDFAAYEFERTLRHGTRRAAEMRESAATLAELGLGADLANAIADVHAQMGAVGISPDAADDPRTLAAGVLAARRARAVSRRS